jgi:hypothetical protein
MSNDHLEINIYKEKISYGGRPILTQKRNVKEREKDDYEKALVWLQSSRRSKKQFTRLIHANTNVWPEPSGKILPPSFLSLTFAENITNLKEANAHFSRFIKRLNYLSSNGNKKSLLKYIVVPEFQKRGAVHYHVLFFNLPHIKKEKIAEAWGFGFIDIKKSKNVDKAIHYMTKYMSKELGSNMPKSARRYFSSNNLKKPITSRNEKQIKFFMDLYSERLEKIKTFEKQYTSKYSGDFNYFVYDFKKDPKLKKELLAFRGLMGLQ